MAIDLNSLEYQSRKIAGGNPSNQKSTYGIDFSSNGQNYTFIPTSVINTGVKTGSDNYVLPWFLNQDNMGELGKQGQYVDLAGQSWYGDYLKDSVGASTTGFLVPAGTLPFDSKISTTKNDVKGVAQTEDGPAYILDSQGSNGKYIKPNGNVVTLSTGRSILGDVFGGLGDEVSNAFNDTLGSINELGPWATAAISIAYPPAGAVIAAANAGQGAATGAPVEDVALNAAKAALLSNAGSGPFSGTSASGTQAPVVDAGGPVEVLPSATAPTAESLAADYYGVPAGSQYVAPEVTELGKVAGTTEGMSSGTSLSEVGSSGGGINATPGAGTNLASTTGAPGLTSGGTNIAEMGGAQGLTTAGATGGILGAGGITGATGATAAGIGSGIGLTQAATGTGAASAYGAGAAGAGGSSLASILPYTAGASVAGSLIQAEAAKDAADKQSAAAQSGIEQQQRNFETINAQQAPYRAAGYNALNNIAGMTAGQTPQYDANGNIIKDANGNPVMTTGSGYFQHQFDKNDLTSGLAPNYDFMLGQGQMANQRAANMGGGALGGNALQGLNKYTQDYAGNAYQTAFTNYQNQRSNIYNTLAGIAGIGQTGQTQTNTAANNATNAATQLGVGSAAAQAAGTTGAANAYGNALSNVTNQYTLAALLNQGGRVGG